VLGLYLQTLRWKRRCRNEGTGEVIARALVDHPDDVKVETVDGPQATVVELRVHPEDWAK